MRTLIVGSIVLLVSGISHGALAQDASPSVAAKLPSQETRAFEDQSPAQVEAEIKDLHDKLLIKADQEAKWADVAKAIRDTGKEMRDKLNARAVKFKGQKFTAVDEIRAHQELAQIRYDSLSRLIGPFERLYQVLKPEQRVNADVAFE